MIYVFLASLMASNLGMAKQEWVVPAEDAGKKLIAFLANRLGDRYSARCLKRMLEENQCRMNGRTERFASMVLARGDHVVLNISEEKRPAPIKVNLSHILYEDDSFVIYNKPAGVNSDNQGIIKLLSAYHPGLQLIHRLDRDTTGALLLAKDPEIVGKMIQAFKQQRVRKCYIALVDGILEKDEGSIDNYLAKKHVYEGQAIWGIASKGDGLHAHTDWIKIQEGRDVTLIYCFPLTGRTHQIRVHLAGIRHPILGDFQYSKKFRCSYQPSRYLLHAFQLAFEHPLTRQTIEIKAPLPKDFLQAQKQLFQESFSDKNEGFNY